MSTNYELSDLGNKIPDFPKDLKNDISTSIIKLESKNPFTTIIKPPVLTNNIKENEKNINSFIGKIKESISNVDSLIKDNNPDKNKYGITTKPLSGYLIEKYKPSNFIDEKKLLEISWKIKENLLQLNNLINKANEIEKKFKTWWWDINKINKLRDELIKNKSEINEINKKLETNKASFQTSLTKWLWEAERKINLDMKTIEKNLSWIKQNLKEGKIPEIGMTYVNNTVNMLQKMWLSEITIAWQVNNEAIIIAKTPSGKFIWIWNNWQFIEWDNKKQLLDRLAQSLNTPYLLVINDLKWDDKDKVISQYTNSAIAGNMWSQGIWDFFNPNNHSNIRNWWWITSKAGDFSFLLSKDQWWAWAEVMYWWENIQAKVYWKTDFKNYATWWGALWTEIPITNKLDLLLWVWAEWTVTLKDWQIATIWWKVEIWGWFKYEIKQWEEIIWYISATWTPTTKVWVWNIKNQIITKAWLDLSAINAWISYKIDGIYFRVDYEKNNIHLNWLEEQTVKASAQIPLWNDFFVWWSVSKSSDINWNETKVTWNVIYKF